MHVSSPEIKAANLLHDLAIEEASKFLLLCKRKTTPPGQLIQSLPQEKRPPRQPYFRLHQGYLPSFHASPGTQSNPPNHLELKC